MRFMLTEIDSPEKQGKTRIEIRATNEDGTEQSESMQREMEKSLDL